MNLFGKAILIIGLIVLGYTVIAMGIEESKQRKRRAEANAPLTEEQQEALKRKLLADVQPSPEEQKANELHIREAKKSKWGQEKLSPLEERRRRAEENCRAARVSIGNLPIVSLTPNQLQLLNACQVLGYY